MPADSPLAPPMPAPAGQARTSFTCFNLSLNFAAGHPAKPRTSGDFLNLTLNFGPLVLLKGHTNCVSHDPQGLT